MSFPAKHGMITMFLSVLHWTLQAKQQANPLLVSLGQKMRSHFECYICMNVYILGVVTIDMFKKLRDMLNSSPKRDDGWVVVFLDRNDFRLQAMQRRLEEKGIRSFVEKQSAIYVHESELEEAKQTVSEWVN